MFYAAASLTAPIFRRANRGSSFSIVCLFTLFPSQEHWLPPRGLGAASASAFPFANGVKWLCVCVCVSGWWTDSSWLVFYGCWCSFHVFSPLVVGGHLAAAAALPVPSVEVQNNKHYLTDSRMQEYVNVSFHVNLIHHSESYVSFGHFCFRLNDN